MDKRYQVFISSTYTDLKEERKAIIECLLNARFIPAGMETFTASNDEQFQYIKKIIDTCDYYVLILGARYGSVNPTTGKSFTEQEYDYAVEKNIPILAFLHDDPYNLPSDKREDDKRELFENFRNKVLCGRLCKMWHNKFELDTAVIISLMSEVANNPQVGWTRLDEKSENVQVKKTVKEDNEATFYLLNVARTLSNGNYYKVLVWWSEIDKYTDDLHEAKKFSYFEICNRVINNSFETKKFVAIPVSIAWKFSQSKLGVPYIDILREDSNKFLGNREIYLSEDEIKIYG